MAKSSFRVLSIAMLILLTGCPSINSNQTSGIDFLTWVETSYASDYNHDSSIDESDWQIWKEYRSWLDSDDAIDFDGDRKINFIDYELWKALNDWITSSDARDFNNDTKIDEDDYEVWKSYLIWKESDEASDLNSDSIINIDDYEIFLNPPLTDYDIWLASSNAKDYTGDEQINEDDYQYWLAYQTWRNSDDAEDFNGDRKINELDYDIFLNPPVSGYELWLESTDAKDYNGDEIIDEDDYQLFLFFIEFAGTYKIVNYIYMGTEIVFYSTGLRLSNFGLYLENITFDINNYGEIVVNIPQGTRETFGEDYLIIEEALNNLTIQRLSPLIITLDTSVTIENLPFLITIYMTEGLSGYSTIYRFNFSGADIVISFDIIRLDVS